MEVGIQKNDKSCHINTLLQGSNSWEWEMVLLGGIKTGDQGNGFFPEPLGYSY